MFKTFRVSLRKKKSTLQTITLIPTIFGLPYQDCFLFEKIFLFIASAYVHSLLIFQMPFAIKGSAFTPFLGPVDKNAVLQVRKN